MISQERSLHFRLVVLIVFYTGSMSVTLVGKFHLDEGSGFLWFLHFQLSSRSHCLPLKALAGCSDIQSKIVVKSKNTHVFSGGYFCQHQARGPNDTQHC